MTRLLRRALSSIALAALPSFAEPPAPAPAGEPLAPYGFLAGNAPSLFHPSPPEGLNHF